MQPVAEAAEVVWKWLGGLDGECMAICSSNHQEVQIEWQPTNLHHSKSKT